MAHPWFESVAEAQRRAKKRLPKGVYGALVAGSERGLTLDDNLAAFAELGFAPHTAGLANERNMGVTVMGQPMSMPILISPTGVQAVHPDGEVAVARAAAARATATSPSGWTACTPVGLISTGMDSDWPMTVTPMFRSLASPAVCGAKPSSAKAARLSALVRPRSDPATRAP